MRSDKRGISAIVATVLIILITVAAVTIIWAAIIPMIQDNLTSGENFETRAEVITSEGWSIYDKESNVLMVQVKATGDFSKMEFVITNEGNSKTIEITDVPLNNQKKTYTWTETDSTYNITKLELGDSDSVTVKVIPYLVDGGSEKIGTISAEVTLKSKKSNVETTGPSTDPTECNSGEVVVEGECKTIGCSELSKDAPCYGTSGKEGTCDYDSVNKENLVCYSVNLLQKGDFTSFTYGDSEWSITPNTVDPQNYEYWNFSEADAKFISGGNTNSATINQTIDFSTYSGYNFRYDIESFSVIGDGGGEASGYLIIGHSHGSENMVNIDSQAFITHFETVSSNPFNFGIIIDPVHIQSITFDDISVRVMIG